MNKLIFAACIAIIICGMIELWTTIILDHDIFHEVLGIVFIMMGAYGIYTFWKDRELEKIKT